MSSLISFIVAGTIMLSSGVSTPLHNADVHYVKSWYNPELGGINSDSDPTVMASGYKVADYYGIAAACPRDMMGKYVSLGDDTYRCLDTGGSVKLRYEGGSILIPIDLLSRDEVDCNMCWYPEDGYMWQKDR